MGKDIFIAGIGDEGQFDQDGWHARVREDMQSVDAGFGNLYATICRIQGIDDLALDAARQHTATVTAGAGPGFCAVGFFGFSSIALDDTKMSASLVLAVSQISSRLSDWSSSVATPAAFR